MKYEKEFKKTKTKEQFIKLLVKKYNVKKTTAQRRFYDLKKTVVKKKRISVPRKDMHAFWNNAADEHVAKFKLMFVMDAKKQGIKITKTFLIKNDFNMYEIDVMQKFGLIEE